MDHGHRPADEALPLDPDLDDLAPARGPLHLRISSIALVILGGTAGTAAREAVSLALEPVDGIPAAILAVNLAGAFLLGLLLEALVRGGPDLGRRRALRLLVGTGFMGGFTTYSTLAVDTALLLGDGAVPSGLGYALGTVFVGALATWCGIAVAAVRRGRPEREG